MKFLNFILISFSLCHNSDDMNIEIIQTIGCFLPSFKALNLSRLAYSLNPSTNKNYCIPLFDFNKKEIGVFLDFAQYENLLCGKTIFLYVDKNHNEKTTFPINPITRPIGNNNISWFFVPSGSIDSELVLDFTTSPQCNWYKYQLKQLAKLFLIDRLLTINQLNEIVKDFFHQENDSVYSQIAENDYVLLFFKKNWHHIASFFLEMISCISQVKSNLYIEMEQLLYNFVNERSLDIEWIITFNSSNMSFSDYKKKILLPALMMDFLNILSLYKNPSYKFELIDLIDDENTLKGTKYVCIKITPKSVQFNSSTKFCLEDEKKNLVPFFQLTHKDSSALLFIQNVDIEKLNLSKANLNILHPDYAFSYSDISLK